jgi:hypothetical protein
MKTGASTSTDIGIPTALIGMGPLVCGGTGGSGTRVFARALREAGMYTGQFLNGSEDAVLFGEFSDAFINRVHGGGQSPKLEAEMIRKLRRLLARHLEPLAAEPRAWGWKEPRSIYLLPFWHRVFPTLRYVHVVRDGRDMAFSTNQNQLRKHGAAVLEPHALDGPLPVQSIRLWTAINAAMADFGESVLGDRYLRLRFEDICTTPEPVLNQLFAFAGLSGDAARPASGIAPPSDAIGRWRHQDPAVVPLLHEIAGPTLERFGYV